jgi:hypothetical protein
MADITTQPDPPATVADMLLTERETMKARRRHIGGAGAAEPNAHEPVGLALSGGGIRSATFSLGVLQELHARGLLTAFDYLSTVSGGGYVGGWWSALLARRENDTVFPEPRTGPPDRENRLLHHLRLHSNYLIPHLGAFSWDAWRAITVIGRNLVLTWLVLVPFVVAGMTAAQFYFLTTAPALVVTHRTISTMVIGEWWAAASPIVAGMLTAVGALTFIWMRYQRQEDRSGSVKAPLPGLGWWATLLMIGTLLVVYVRKDDGYSTPGLNALRDQPEFTMAVCLLLALAAFLWREIRNPAAEVPSRDLHRNNIAIVQQLFMMGLAGGVVLLVAGGLGHLLIGSAVSATESWIARAGGVASVVLTVAGAGWSAFRTAGIGGGTTSSLTRPLLRILPALLVVVLFAMSATFSRDVIVASQQTPLVFEALVTVSFYGVVLAWVYAAYETSWTSLFPRTMLTRALTFVGGVSAGVIASVGDATPVMGPIAGYAPIALAIVSMLTVARRLGGVLFTDDEEPRYTSMSGRLRLEAVVGALFVAGVALGWWVAPSLDVILPASALLTARAGAVGMIVTAGLAAISWRYGSGQRTKGLLLLLYAGVVSTLWAFIARGNGAAHTPLVDAFALMTATATWTLAFGWAVDPNNLALYAFYKARLVRAYMGASNKLRYERGTLIDDSVPGDDVALTALRNETTGAPYHLINATLNMAGDQTLGSLQRRAAPFLFSRHYCGSPHPSCGFRPTSQYMGGGLTLGTTVTISGAAACPEMGSQTPSAAMSMLLTLFNVRLGFWAPMPGAAAWRSRAARFWAFYTLREFLARTGDRASYGFLSDGGHFDNTAVYSLIARGVRVIVAADCGADPDRSFEDYGNVIRRCRIDFGAEISMRTDVLRESPPDALARSSFVIGSIQYSRQHLIDIGDPTPDNTTGYILVIKPSIVGVEPLDVRQYRAYNPVFPQQPTSDQFYDEAQFESYRRLGACCADSALNALSGSGPAVDAKTLTTAVKTFNDRRAAEEVVESLTEAIGK